MTPVSYDLKRVIAERAPLFWQGADLIGIPTAPVYLFADQQRFDSDEVDAIACRLAGTPLCLPHDEVLFEVTDRDSHFSAQVAYVRRTIKGVEASLLLRSRSSSRWTDVVCSAFFRGDGYADVEPNPRMNSAGDLETFARVLTGIVWRALGLLSIGPVVTDQSFPRTRRPKLAKIGVAGWNWKLVDIDLDRIPKEARGCGGTHASPRWHIRRGHWRTLLDGRRVFVQPCEVGDRTRGGIVKDYTVFVGDMS